MGVKKFSPRRAVAQALLRVDNGGFSNIVISHALERAQLSQKDRAFASALFYGVLERRMTLDYVISQYVSRPMNRLDPELLQTLRLSLYQLIYMDSIPDAVAVNEGIELIKEMRKTSCSSLVNGLLRSFIRNGKRIEFGNKSGAELLSLKYSVSIDIAELLIRDYGDCAESILENSFGSNGVDIRVNTLKTTRDEYLRLLENSDMKAEIICGTQSGVRISSPGDVRNLPGFSQGLFHVQGAASQICAEILGASEGETVFDMCAAPGGKSFTIAQNMNNKGRLMSFDLHENKLGLILDGCHRLGIDIVFCERNDATVYRPDLKEADRVLCDVACSGLGIISKKPEIRFKSQKSIDGFDRLQYNILGVSSRYVRVGGRLVYSTCTLNKDENERRVEEFLKEHDDFELDLSVDALRNNGMYTFLPDNDGTDGFFICAMKRVK